MLTHIKQLDDCFGMFLVRVSCTCGSVREIKPEALARRVGWVSDAEGSNTAAAMFEMLKPGARIYEALRLAVAFLVVIREATRKGRATGELGRPNS
jgi:hypothetical protein